MTKRSLAPAVLFVSSLLWYGCASTTDTPPVVETGVSLELANYRKTVISALGYQLSFDIPDDKSEDIPASEVITFNLSKNDADLQIDFKEDSDHVLEVVVNSTTIPVDHREEHILVPKSALRPGSNSIKITFVAGNLSLNRNDEYLYTLLVPDRARTVFPCFDQPNLKASYQLSLTMPGQWQALSNGPLADSVISGERKTFNFMPSDTISTYLFAFAAGKFQKVTRTVDGRTMSLFHRETDEEKISESIDTIFYLHGKALDFLEEYTAIPYPFKKFDFVAIPDFQYGGMEHVGAIQYRASSLFLDKTATQSRKIGRANLIAHETAHMWFGDLVTMDWFNDVWMKEVFANFMADKVSEVTFPNTGSDLKFLLAHYPAAYAVDRTPGANPVRQQLDNLKDAGSMYGAIIYHKAPIVMKQLEMLMGKQEFQRGLQQYLSEFAFSNATWTDLINILDQRTGEDLLAWNKVWVEEPFRPVFSYDMKTNEGLITALTISQKEEKTNTASSGDKVWSQAFKVGLSYGDSLIQVPAFSYRAVADVGQATGRPKPNYIVFNTSGEGYGVFLIDSVMLPYIGTWNDPVARASAYINNYENMLNGDGITPTELLALNTALLSQETEELSVRQLTSQLSATYWQFITPSNRKLISQSLESEVWAAMEQAPSASIKKMLFGAFQEIATSEKGMEKLYGIWKSQAPPKEVKLSEDDYTGLAATLSLLSHPKSDEIQQQQLARINNGDRKKRWEFLLPALSSDTATRNTFFESLKLAENREKESWVTTAVSYLHHPERQHVSIGYLKESLELLSDIQATGDIFFPTAWLSATFGAYQSDEAASIVNSFLSAHPNYPLKLKGKILQTTDDLNRASRLLKSQSNL
ncbi:M1 family aminopeptidase [uncultured Imperialibacter sp.]|uniref:M1 family metallopeptidase n=1 Tax=uncultured Imperialibacter sp. TaxID=1672639 RepID=UPI0030DC148E|tara:strand:- start:83941 stop:86544 length:2604 start_codon:yes stop_codon:yes gene_type:complete